MVTEPLADVVAVRAVGGYLLELAYPHGQVRLLDAEPLPSPRAYEAVRADHAAFAYAIASPLADTGLGVVKGGTLHSAKISLSHIDTRDVLWAQGGE